MKHSTRIAVAAVLLTAGMAVWQLARADIEAATPDGRRVLLRDNGTWTYVETRPREAAPTDTKGKEASAKDATAKDATAKDATAKDATAKDATAKDVKQVKDRRQDGELLLLLDRKTELGTTCRFGLELVNKLQYEVTSLVLYFSAYRPEGVLYATETPGRQFGSLKPGNSQRRELEFRGIGCKEIARLQVSGGDRCTMGDLHRWSDSTEVKGQCLARVKVVESSVVKFEK
jgi:hypothetical protein